MRSSLLASWVEAAPGPESDPPRPPMRGPALFWRSAIIVAGVVLGCAALLWLVLDLDGDALNTFDELRAGTNPFLADSDLDRLPDGWEDAHGSDPLRADTDADTLQDQFEFVRRMSPTSNDSDADDVLDPTEVVSDLDPLDADMDDDALLDGRELLLGTDATKNDTDEDGLLDAQEVGSEFSPLDADTFGVGLVDAVSWAFKQAGQAPSGDLDRDGIPDAWETEDGAIQWGPFHPRPNQTDLLIEAIRVEGPDSSRFDSLDFSTALARVAQAFAQNQVVAQIVPTKIVISNETRPAIIPSSFAPFYADLLARTSHSSNPYVTTLVLNPQHDQSSVLHAGVAPIRGMLAAVDYGEHTLVRFHTIRTTYDAGCRCNVQQRVDVTLSPFFESLIVGGRLDAIQAIGFQGGGVDPNGEFYLQAASAKIVWRPSWYARDVRLVWNDGSVNALLYDSAEVDLDELAHTVFHELGHTLGLCHLELPECAAGLSSADRFRVAQSAMHSSSTGALVFLESEWRHVRDYLRCPPYEAVGLVARGASAAEVRDAKYGYTLAQVLDVGSRACGVFPSVQARHSAAAYVDPSRPLPYLSNLDVDVPDVENSPNGSVAYAGAGILVAVAAGGPFVRRRPSPAAEPSQDFPEHGPKP